MKTYKQILKEMTKNKNTIKELETRAETLEFLPERNAAANAKDFNSLKELRTAADDNRAEINAIYKKIESLKITNKILSDNVHAAMWAEIIPVLIEIFKPYEGKAYGPATKEKIRDAARAHGFSFYIDGFLSSDSITIYLLNENGYTLHFDNEKTTEIQKYNRVPFISSENKIQFAAALENVSNPYRYTENTKKAVNDIKKAFDKYIKAAETARAAQDNLNNLLPARMRFDKVDNPKYLRLI